MIETSLRTTLLASSSLTAESSNNIYIGYIPKEAGYPCIGIFEISNTEGHNYDLARTRMQFTCFGNTYSSAKGICESIKNVLKRYYGTMSTVFVIHSVVDQDVYLYDDSINKHCFILDMFFKYVK